jgi:tetratricopeptide (TPR) repeat protein
VVELSNSESIFERAKELFFLGLNSFEKGEYASSEEYLFASLRKIPERVSTLTNLAAAQIRLKKYDLALENSSKAVTLDASNSEAWLNLGLSYYRITILARLVRR